MTEAKIGETVRNDGVRAGEWTIQRGTDRFIAPDLEVLQEWFRDRRVLPTDLVFHPSLGDWKRAADVPDLRPAVGLPAGLRPAAIVALIVGGGFMMLFMTCVGLVLRGSKATQATSEADTEESPSQSSPSRLIRSEDEFLLLAG